MSLHVDVHRRWTGLPGFLAERLWAGVLGLFVAMLPLVVHASECFDMTSSESSSFVNLRHDTNFYPVVSSLAAGGVETTHMAFHGDDGQLYYGRLSDGQLLTEAILGLGNSAGCRPYLDLDVQGAASVVFLASSPTPAILYSTRASGRWSQPVTVAADVRATSGLAAGRDGSGRLHVLYVTNQSRLAWATLQNGVWDRRTDLYPSALPVNGQRELFLCLKFKNSGRAVVVFYTSSGLAIGEMNSDGSQLSTRLVDSSFDVSDPDLAINPAQEPVIAYRKGGLVSVQRLSGASWVDLLGGQAFAHGGYLRGTAVAVNEGGTVFASFSSSPTDRQTLLVISGPPCEGIEQVSLEGASLSPRLAVAGRGRWALARTQYSSPTSAKPVLGIARHEPSIKRFWALPSLVERGNPVTLTWDASGGRRVSIEPGIGEVPLSGSLTLTPLESVTFELSLETPDGLLTRSATVSVRETPCAGRPDPLMAASDASERAAVGPAQREDYIVRFWQPAEQARESGQIPSLGRAIRTALPGYNGAIEEFQRFPLARAELTTEEARRVRLSPLVRSVFRDTEVRVLDAEGNALIGATELRRAGLNGDGVGIAVIDTGVDDGHAEFRGSNKVIRLRNVLTGGQDTLDDFPPGHGTQVAGIAAGSSSGVAPGAWIAALKTCSALGRCRTSDRWKALEEILLFNEGRPGSRIRVANISQGGYFPDETGKDKPPEPGPCDARSELACQEKAILDELLESGVLVVAGAGNGACTSGIAFPACLSSSFSAGAVLDASLSLGLSFGLDSPCSVAVCGHIPIQTAPDLIACYSDSGDRLDVWAPSHCATSPAPGGGYSACFGGTSSAAPYLAGAAALLFQAQPGASPLEVRDALRETGKPVTDSRNSITRNRIDLERALNSLLASPPSGQTTEKFLPVVLDADGRGGARYLSELTLTNRGQRRLALTLEYVPAASSAGSVGGSVTDLLSPMEQRRIPDAIEYLRGRGLSIPRSPNQIGSLRVSTRNASRRSDLLVASRVLTHSCTGKAGLHVPAADVAALQAADRGESWVFGLRETDSDRSNLAIANAGRSSSISLRITLYDGEGKVPPRVLPLEWTANLLPGEWRQLVSSQLLGLAGLRSAFARIERVAGTQPFVAYGVFNDNRSNDGSYVAAVAPEELEAEQWIPAAVHTASYRTELILSNPGPGALSVSIAYYESLTAPRGLKGTFAETLGPFQQKIIPDLYARMVQAGMPAVSACGAAGSLQVAFQAAGGTALGFSGVRVSSPKAECGGASYGLFVPSVMKSAISGKEAWIRGLAESGDTRSNLALLNLSDTTGLFEVQLFDGVTGRSAGSPLYLLPGKTLYQINKVLASSCVSNSYVRVSRRSGIGDFLAYAVLNDGAIPGSRTDDGTFVSLERE